MIPRRPPMTIGVPRLSAPPPMPSLRSQPRMVPPRGSEEVDLRVHVVLEPQKEGGFTVTVPSMPGCISEGETRAEALQNIKEAIELWLAAGVR